MNARTALGGVAFRRVALAAPVRALAFEDDGPTKLLYVGKNIVRHFRYF
jgi:hypothetical protein